jgi:hypothetical protein
MSDFIFSMGQGLLSAPWWTSIAWPTIWALIKVTVVLMVVMGAVTYATLWERKLLGWVQIRIGPNRVGPWGLLQPIADALKLMTKEIVSPAASDKFLFFSGASADCWSCVGGVGCDPVRPRDCGGQPERRIVVPHGHFLLGGLRSDCLRLVF